MEDKAPGLMGMFKAGLERLGNAFGRRKKVAIEAAAQNRLPEGRPINPQLRAENQQRLQNTMQKAHEHLLKMRKKLQARRLEMEAAAASGQMPTAENMSQFTRRMQRQNMALRKQLQDKLQKFNA